jgi:insertion element IS1 protein InsB
MILVKNKVMSDYWKVYECFVSKEKHIQSKSETYTVEVYNSILRHKLARLHPKKTVS